MGLEESVWSTATVAEQESGRSGSLSGFEGEF